jgi:flagellar basal body-associated protein FliL
LAVVGVYKPKNMRQRRLKVAILVISGALVAATVVHTFIFVQGQANTIEGAGIGFGVGVYVAIISSALLVFSGLSATKEVNSENMDTQNVLSWRAS